MADEYCAMGTPILLPALVFLLDIISGSVWMHQTQIVGPKEQAKELKESLALTDAQAAKLLRIYGDWDAVMSNVLSSGRRDRETEGEILLEIMKESEKQIGSLLTDGQQRNLIRLGLGV